MTTASLTWLCWCPCIGKPSSVNIPNTEGFQCSFPNKLWLWGLCTWLISPIQWSLQVSVSSDMSVILECCQSTGIFLESVVSYSIANFMLMRWVAPTCYKSLCYVLPSHSNLTLSCQQKCGQSVFTVSTVDNTTFTYIRTHSHIVGAL